MTPADLKAARAALGMNAAALGRALELEGKDPGRSVRLWESGKPIPGPARVAVRYMLAEKAQQTAQEAQRQAGALMAAQAPPEALSGAQNAGFQLQTEHPKSRRRG